MKSPYIPLAEQLDFRSYRLALLLVREINRALEPFGLTQEKWQVLAALWEAGASISQTRVAELTFKDKPSISRLASALVKTGWVTRINDKTDGRAYLLKASAKADAKRQEIIEAIAAQFRPYHLKLGESSRTQLRTLLGMYISILETRCE